MTNIKDFSSAKSGKIKKTITISTKDGETIYHSGERVQPLIEENGWLLIVELSSDEDEGFELSMFPKENVAKVKIDREEI